jgi:uncharacterized repeat protein (TIGR02543 family)
VQVVGNGGVTLDPPGGIYTSGTTIELSAISDPDWMFTGWSGDLAGTENPATIVMSGDMNVTATFEPDLVTWTAYNDLAAPNNTVPTTNITVITTPDGGNVGLPHSGDLIDFNTGTGTGVTLAVTGGLFNGTSHTDTYTGEPASGTDAFGVFDGFLNALGTISYNNLASPGGDLVLAFTGMDPGKSYNLVYYGHRNDYAWDRAALVTLSGALTFTNESTAATDNPTGPGGALFSGPADDSTRLPSDNDNGYVARFTDVLSGNDGEVLLTVSFDGTTGNEYKGKYANVLMIEEAGEAPPLYALTVNTVGNGSVILDPPGGVYLAGTSVQMTALANPGWTFNACIISGIITGV